MIPKLNFVSAALGTLFVCGTLFGQSTNCPRGNCTKEGGNCPRTEQCLRQGNGKGMRSAGRMALRRQGKGSPNCCRNQAADNSTKQENK